MRSGLARLSKMFVYLLVNLWIKSWIIVDIRNIECLSSLSNISCYSFANWNPKLNRNLWVNQPFILEKPQNDTILFQTRTKEAQCGIEGFVYHKILIIIAEWVNFSGSARSRTALKLTVISS